ncbi:class I SAM-dependent methyltransferase, partial [Acidobacteria bacterium AH-259-D05]|nr:class I SAM-dependent methyltransferase [Acidobacteria bacterium AH-259-D05]
PCTKIVSFIMRTFGKEANKSEIKILDLGCGWGNNLKFLRDKEFDYYGIDFSRAAVEHCQESFKNIVQGDLSKLPYGNSFFHCVFDRQAIQHNSKEGIRQIFKEVYRVLKASGIFYSVLIAKAKFDVYTTYLTEDEIRALTQSFLKVDVDYVEISTDNQTDFLRVHVLTAEK